MDKEEDGHQDAARDDKSQLLTYSSFIRFLLDVEPTDDSQEFDHSPNNLLVLDNATIPRDVQ